MILEGTVPTRNTESSNVPSLDVIVETSPRVAGIERGRLYNNWLDCPFEVRPSAPGSPVGETYAWTAVFKTTDSNEARRFAGSAGTRRLASAAALDSLTRHMSMVAEDRRLALYGTSEVPELQKFAGVPAKTARGVEGLWERFARLFTSLYTRFTRFVLNRVTRDG